MNYPYWSISKVTNIIFQNIIRDSFILQRRKTQHQKIFIPILFNLPLKKNSLIWGILCMEAATRGVL